MTALNTITVLGTGVLGSQIAYQTAYHGLDVVAYDVSEEALAAARTRFEGLAARYRAEVPGATEESTAAAVARIRLTDDLADAVSDADLVIEAVPERLDIKRDTYTRLAALAPARAIFASNSSTLLPSDMKDFTGRPDRFLALHYANLVWVHNTAEIMGTADTDPEVYRAVVDFARRTGMEPIELKKEKAGYVLNSLLVPLLDAGAKLFADGIADPETVDKTWRIGTGAPMGPFQIFDVVGLNTAYNISATSPDEGMRAFAEILKRDYIDKGKLGVGSGEGFYRYS
ncbi:3-hydroxyacyl-CoA dehydrogenase [Mycetocola reblochoni]|uniref:3-hydroxybutyryl-CoA dehydrogenase 3-hydroxyacyl-CoA dehydrogenase n=2 Tax=Mycetocola reblochoni TaxID=331618 RepID=A0A1R4KBY7_9MICO|nr:3-hydroxyacyl-CoA dehydrogenase [Mycetocola reblochoni]RLP68557.1 3-hydroxyacyl-CoA dehydrogenase [Mycetocola reblochoni]SJN41807.1 3-hydroxybutyryl-CoA dehydrogenase; 3-hydroxyacyl-CoA dehydrogenase [Mycetocola reblochoni REB411]